MKKIIILICFVFAGFSLPAQNYNDLEGFPDRDLFGNYIVIRLSNFCSTKMEAKAEMDKFKVYCEENPYLKPYTEWLGLFQIKSIEKEKSAKWIAGYCNFKRQKKELYEMDEKFLETYCTSAEIYQFKQLVKNEFCFDEKADKK